MDKESNRHVTAALGFEPERDVESDELRGVLLHTPFGDFLCGDCVVHQEYDWLMSTGWRTVSWVVKVEQAGDVVFDTETIFDAYSEPPYVRHDGVRCGPVVRMSGARMVVPGEEELDPDDLESHLGYIRDNCYITTRCLFRQFT